MFLSSKQSIHNKGSFLAKIYRSVNLVNNMEINKYGKIEGDKVFTYVEQIELLPEDIMGTLNQINGLWSEAVVKAHFTKKQGEGEAIKLPDTEGSNFRNVVNSRVHPAMEKYCKDRKWYEDCRKKLSAFLVKRDKGCPDIVWISKEHPPYFIEIKTGTSPVSKDQIKCLRELSSSKYEFNVGEEKYRFLCYIMKLDRIDMAAYLNVNAPIVSVRKLNDEALWEELNEQDTK